MLAYQITQAAQTDLLGIRSYTARKWGDLQAIDYLEEIKKTIHLLQEFPALGKASPELGTGVYRYPFGSHLIIYQLDNATLTVLRLKHQRMLPENIKIS